MLHGGGGDQLDRWVFEDRALVVVLARLGVALRELCRQIRLLGIERGQFGPRPHQQIDLAVDMGVVDADDAKTNRRWLSHRGVAPAQPTAWDMAGIALVWKALSECGDYSMP